MNKMIRFGVAMLTLGLMLCEAHAQGFGLLAEHGAGINAGYASQNNVTQFGFGAGYVVHPLLEVGFSAGRNIDDATKITATAVGPFVGIYPIRMSSNMPLSVRLGAGYNRLLFAGDAVKAMDAMGVEMSGNNFQATGALFVGVPIRPTLFLVPLAELGFTRTNLNIEAGGNSQSQDETLRHVTVGGSLVVAASPGSRFAFTPAVTFVDGVSRFGVSAMMVLPR